MDIRSHIMRFRTNRKNHNRSNPLGMIGLLIALLISMIAAGGVIFGVYLYSEITDNLPPPVMLERLLDPPDGSLLEPTKIFDKTGEAVLWQFENPLVEYRRYLNITDGSMLFYQEVSRNLINAFLAAQDPEYFNKPETFLVGIWDNQADPIPEKMVEELLLWNETDHPYREIRINLLADQIVGRYGREKVLEWFLNNAYFGNQIYGVNQAALIYFGKSAADLDLAESALLAAVANYPSLNPYDSQEAAKENQEIVLGLMTQAGLITRTEETRAIQKQLIYPDPETAAGDYIPAFVAYILKEADEFIPRDRLIRGGYRIISTLDYALQQELECTAELMTDRVYGNDPDLDPNCQAARLLPKYSGPYLNGSDQLEIGLVLLDPLSGELLAMVGPSNLNTPRNPGTTLTPFLYLNYFTQGFEPASLVWDIPLDDVSMSEQELHPGCEQDCEFKGPVNIRTAMINDYLSPAKQLWESQGNNQIENTLTLFGFSLGKEICLDCEIFSDGPELNIIDLAQGYGVFVNQGFLRGRSTGGSILDVQPAAILNIEDQSGWSSFYDLGFVENKIINEQLAYMVNHILSDEISRENGDIFKIGRPAGVKTGFVPESESAWVIGYTPSQVTAIWAGNPVAKNQAQADYIQISSALWRAITQQLSRGQESSGWVMPAGISTLDVCYPSGMLPGENCPREVREVFIEGNEPQGVDTLYQALEINRETGLLASVFTPGQLIEERVYLDLPPEALSWAEGAGISTPPTLYDLDSRVNEIEGFSISTPDNLSFINERVRIIGSIPEDGFRSARLQYGFGMNPGSWLQIGPEITSPADNIRLGTWNTADLEDGVYAIQLVLIRDNQQIDKVSLVVSVDNSPPEISLITDLTRILHYERGKDLIFEVGFENKFEISRVDFFLNGNLLSSRKINPYLYPWEMQPGSYELGVKAYDQAGNQSELSVEFIVLAD
ncbi:MAG: transglycosylase domain-containing protein [Anaerolineales bacterium]